jgi:nucleoside-diphosphate-sugar epimerase
MKGKVLVTGASGFIGSHLTRRLLDECAEVHAIRKKDSDNSRLSGLEGMKIHDGSITDADFVRKALDESRPDIVFHLAGVLRKDSTQESLTSNMDVNFLGTLNLLKALPNGVKRLVFVSTSEGYAGKPPFPEDSKRTPSSPYSASKICAETLCELFSKTHGIPITVLRPFIVYGPGQGRGMLIPDLIMSMLGGKPLKTTKGEQTRDFVYIGDMVEALILASSEKEAAGQTYNVCTGKETKIRDVISEIARLTGGKSDAVLPYRENEVFSHFGDNRKLISIGWKPKTSIEQGLEETVEWYKKNHKD